MGGVRNGKSEVEPGPPGSGQETLAVDALPRGPEAELLSRMDQHLQVALRLLREGQAPKAFGELVRATRSLPMTRRLASALVTVSLKAGTEAAAITLLSGAVGKVEGAVRRDVSRQLARVLRKVDQLPRAIEALEALLAVFPADHASRRILQLLLERTGRWEALVASLEREALEAFKHGEYSRAARATRWRARIQAEQLRNLARAAESYGQAANYLEQMEDAVGAFSVRLDGLRVLHGAGASEAVLTAAASVCMSAAARLGRDAQARQVLEELGLIPRSVEPASLAEPKPEARSLKNTATVEMSLPLLQAMLAVASSVEDVSSKAIPEVVVPVAAPPAEAAAAPSPEPATPSGSPVQLAEVAAAPSPEPTTPEVARSEPEPESPRPEPEPEAPPVEAAAAPSSPEEEPPAPQAEAIPSALDEDSEAMAAPEEESSSGELMAGDGSPLTELLEIPDEEAAHLAPPVSTDEAPVAQEPEAEDAAPSDDADEDEEDEEEDSAAQQRVEAQLIARKAWRELAQFYLARADAAKDPQLRAEALTRLAELMENELSDPSGAARIYREIVTLTGDREALKEQVRLLTQRGDPSLVRRALDEAVQTARTPKARAAAYLTRAELELQAGQSTQAKADFETAEALTPGMLLVLAGLVRCVPGSERSIMASRLRASLAAAPRRSPDRLDALRVLATVADEPLKDAKLAQWAWTEVLAEDPGEEHARKRLLELARVLGDKAALGQLLREHLAREPRGPAARSARMELVATLEDTGDVEGGLTELRQAVRFEPGHKEAWLLLADRLTERGQIGEAAWALDNAASAMEDEAERLRTWQRLASFCHNVLKDPTRAETYSRRAENLRRSMGDKSVPPVPEPPRAAVPPRREPGAVTGSRSQILIPPPANVELTPSGQAFPPAKEEPATDIHNVAASLPDDSRPTIEFSAVAFPGEKMPFGEDEPTATEAPEGFLPPDPAPPAPPPKKASPPAAAPKKNVGKKLKIENLEPSRDLDASRELDSLLGEQEESDHTSPFLSAWSMKRPQLQPKGAKDKAPAPPPVAEKKAGSGKAAPEKAAPEKAAPGKAPVRVVEAPPARAKAPPLEVTAPGRRTAMQDPGASKGARGSKRQEAESAFAQVSPREPEGPPAYTSNPVQNTSFISWEAPPGKMEPVRRLARSRGAPAAAPKASPIEPAGAEPAVFKKVREYPLDVDLYFQIAEYFEGRGDTERATLMREIADALDGRENTPARPPRHPLSVDDRQGLRHPILRSPQGELLTCVGTALCRLFPMRGRSAGTQEPLRQNQGAGAPAAIEALRATERLLGIEAPEVVLSEDNGPPFSLVFTNAPRLLVGKQAVRQVLPDPELRFYAGRALICLGPDLLALRCLKKDQVLRGLALLSTVLKDSVSGSTSLEARVVRETLSPEQFDRAERLFGPATRQFDISAMADAARDSSNRAGLIACGGVGPALASLRMKRALEREQVELVRFAASERYFQLRSSR